MKAIRTDPQVESTPYEDAIKYVDLQIAFLKDEWNITEGAAVDELENEKRRLLALIL